MSRAFSFCLLPLPKAGLGTGIMLNATRLSSCLRSKRRGAIFIADGATVAVIVIGKSTANAIAKRASGKPFPRPMFGLMMRRPCANFRAAETAKG